MDRLTRPGPDAEQDGDPNDQEEWTDKLWGSCVAEFSNLVLWRKLVLCVGWGTQEETQDLATPGSGSGTGFAWIRSNPSPL